MQQAITDAQLPDEPLPAYAAEDERYFLEIHRKKDDSIEIRLVDANLRIGQHRDRIKEDRRMRDEAASWLKSAGLDFREVCGMAGLEPAYMARKYAEISID